MRRRIAQSLVTAATMRLKSLDPSVGGRRAASAAPARPTSIALCRFPPSSTSNRRVTTAAAAGAPPPPSSPTRDGGSLRKSHVPWTHRMAHLLQQQQSAATSSSAAVADVDFDVDEIDDDGLGAPPPASAPLRVSFGSLPRFEQAFPNALSSRTRAIEAEGKKQRASDGQTASPSRKKELSSPFFGNDEGDEGPPSLAAATHDSKLALFYNVYGPPPTEAAGRGESARAARDALALFHAVFGPPKGEQEKEEEEQEQHPSPSQQRVATTTINPPEPLSPRSARRRLTFSKPLTRGVVLSRPNRFTMMVRLEGDEGVDGDGEGEGRVVACHCPVTGALGGLGLGAFEGAGAPCLVSRVEDDEGEGEPAERPSRRKKKYYSRKTPFTVEAVSLADPSGPPAWVGINQMAANRYIEHFWNAGALPELSSSPTSSGPSASSDDDDEESLSSLSSSDPGASLVRETRVGDTRSRVDFAACGGRDLVEVKCPLDALPLLLGGGGGSEGDSPPVPRPNPALAAAAALRAQTAGERLARLPRARRAAMYERAARHALCLAGHLDRSRKRERDAAARARRRERAAAAKAEREGRGGQRRGGTGDVAAPAAPLASPDDGDVDGERRRERLDRDGSAQKARAILIQCFQFDAPPVRGMLPPPRGADPSSDGRAAVASAMRAAARAGVETWQVNLRFDERGVELLGCFELDLFGQQAQQKERKRGGRRTAGGGSPGVATSSSASSGSESESEDLAA